MMNIKTSFTEDTIATSFTLLRDQRPAFEYGHPITVIVAPGKLMSMAPRVAPNATIDISFPFARAQRL